MITRVTTSMMANDTLANVQNNFQRLADANEKMASGKRMKFASDDPASSVSSMRLRKELAATEQYKRNIDDAQSWMQTADSAMDTVSKLYLHSKTKLINSVSGAMGKESLHALAADLRQNAQAIMTQANKTYLGRTVFAGNSDKGMVFKTGKDANGDLQFMQTEADNVTAMPVDRRINAYTTLPANVDGNKLFGTGTIRYVEGPINEQTGLPDGFAVDDSNNPSVMNLLVEAARIMETGDLGGDKVDKIRAIQNELSRREKLLHTNQSDLGARHKQVLEAQDNVVSDIQAVKTQISGVEDVDIQAATIEMSLAHMAYQAALGSTSRVVQPSLLDYLR